MVVGIVLYFGLIALSAIGVLWGIGSILVGFDRFREERAIRTTPVASLDSIAIGPTAVRGTIEPVGRTIGSIHGCDACVAYELTVKDVGSDASRTHVDRSNVVPFDITTEDGSIRIDEATFDFDVSDRRRWEETRKSHEGVDQALRRFERNWEIPDLRSGDDRKYDASYLCPGDTVYAYGTADLDESREDEASKPLVLTDRDDRFLVSDRDPDALARERRFALAKEGTIGVVVSVVSLSAFLWLTGIAQIFLGA